MAPQQLQALQMTPVQQESQARVVLMALQAGPREVLHWATVVLLLVVVLVVEQRPLATSLQICGCVRGSCACEYVYACARGVHHTMRMVTG